MNLSSFYRSSEWESLRAVLMVERVNEYGDIVCAECGKPIVNKYDCIAHHVKELTEANVSDASISLNPENIVLVHHRCHNKIHQRFGHNKGATYIRSPKHVYVVWGSPCAGKARYVMERAGADDLIIDIDRLYDAMGISRYPITGNVMQVYRSLIDMVRTRNGKWVNAWIVRTLPLKIDRDLILKDCGGGELIHIDTPKDECLLEAERRGGDWTKWVTQYWDYYQCE